MSTEKTTSRVSKAAWTKVADCSLIDEMLKQCERGKKLDNGFKKEVWKEITDDFNQKRPGEDALLVTQVKNRANTVCHVVQFYFIYQLILT